MSEDQGVEVERFCFVCGSACWLNPFLCNGCVKAAVGDAIREERMDEKWGNLRCKTCDGDGKVRGEDWDDPDRTCGDCGGDGLAPYNEAELALLVPTGDAPDIAATLYAAQAECAARAAKIRELEVWLEAGAKESKERLEHFGRERDKNIELEKAQHALKAELEQEKQTSTVLRRELGLIRANDGGAS